MNYVSTRDNSISLISTEAIIKGISSDNGLFVPVEIPKLDMTNLYRDIKSLDSKESIYAYLAYMIFSIYFDDIDSDYLRTSISIAYDNPFNGKPAPLKHLTSNLSVLELFHGPTLAFKDIALQIMPFLFTEAKRRQNDSSHSLILVATSGDTGKAALEGYMDVDGVSIVVFYPKDGVSEIQQLQMTTQEGNNVYVIGVNGNFDDAQKIVKTIMTDSVFQEELSKKGIKFSSANSINIARLIPQIVYYFYSYFTLLLEGKISETEPINFVVPSGNFGNILASYYAKSMGLPIAKLICASNQNDVLTDFIRTGEYNTKRDFFTTLSPSMDILVSSNVERLIWYLTGSSSEKTKRYYEGLAKTGSFKLKEDEHKLLAESFISYSCDDNETKQNIKDVYDRYSYLTDPHTAVAFGSYKKYLDDINDETPTVIVATASPYKFASSVLASFELYETDISKQFDIISTISKTITPKSLTDLLSRQVRFDDSVDIGYEKDLLNKYIETIRA